MPRSAAAFALLALIALAGTMTYTGYLVIGVLADLLGTGRFMAGLLLGGLFARIPWLSKGKLRTVGLLPKIVRRPVMLGLLALCLSSFLARGDYGPALVTGFAAAFILTFPWIKRALLGRVMSSMFKFSAAGQHQSKSIDSTVIDVEFKEKRD
jgi:hypothetical protein